MTQDGAVVSEAASDFGCLSMAHSPPPSLLFILIAEILSYGWFFCDAVPNEAQLRAAVADYMRSFPSLFRAFLHGHEFLRFDQYCDRVKMNSWGDHLTLMAISSLLLRPIRLITPGGVRLVKPPDMIAESAWEPGATRAYHMGP
eukprot:8100116-Pyramimonas_sp.AAC.1